MNNSVSLDSIVTKAKFTAQNVDRNIGPGEYKHLKEDELLITSIFYTLQGEGPFAGMTSVFVRLAGCNLGGKGVTGPGCQFCDTKFFFDQGKIMTFKAILDRVNELSDNRKNTNLIVVTGGEPMLQANVSKFAEYVNENRYHTQFETNGLIYRDIVKQHNEFSNTIIVSPKMGASSKYSELRKDVFDRADVLKFVVERNGNFNYVPDYAKKFLFDILEDGIQQRKKGKLVYVSPINVYLRPVKDGEVPNFFDQTLFDYEECEKNYQKAAELCMKEDYILNIQKHLFARIE